MPPTITTSSQTVLHSPSTKVSIETGVPAINGITVVETHAQAEARAGNDQPRSEFALAALEMAQCNAHGRTTSQNKQTLTAPRLPYLRSAVLYQWELNKPEELNDALRVFIEDQEFSRDYYAFAEELSMAPSTTWKQSTKPL